MPKVVQKKAVKSPAVKGGVVFVFSVVLAVSISWVLGSSARAFFLSSLDDVDPIIAGGELDNLPALMRGNVPAVTTSAYYEEPRSQKPPRMCEMPKTYFEDLDQGFDQAAGYTRRNEYIRKYRPRRGFLNERELRAAKVA